MNILWVFYVLTKFFDEPKTKSDLHICNCDFFQGPLTGDEGNMYCIEKLMLRFVNYKVKYILQSVIMSNFRTIYLKVANI